MGSIDGSSLLPALDGAVGADGADAVVVDGVATSWELLAGRADALGAQLAGMSAVAVRGDASLDTVIAVVAALRAGVPVVPIPADAGPLERSHILNDSSAGALIGAPDWQDISLPRLEIPARATNDGLARPDIADTAPAMIMYTSGTTGLPKGVVIPRRAIAADLDGLADAWAWTPDDRLVHGLPLFHVHGLILGVLGALRVGSKLVHTGRPNADRYAAAQGSMYFGVPTVWSRVAKDEASARALSSARLLVSGSAPLPMPVFDRLRELTGQSPVERYGMTESLITLSTRADGERRPGSVGFPVAGVETRVRSEDGHEVPADGATIGLLEVRGATMFDGYLNLPDRTAEAMTADGWFITGDAVVVSDDGFHQIVGRASIDIIKCGGFKVGAGEVEAALLAHPMVEEAAVIGMPDADLGERIVGFVVGDTADPETLIRHVASLLSVHKRPREVRIVDALPRNAMGKVQKKQLRDP